MSSGIPWGKQQKICEMCDAPWPRASEAALYPEGRIVQEPGMCTIATGGFDDQNKIRVTLDEGATLPSRGSKEAAGLDLYASEDTEVLYRSTLVPTGVHMEIPKGFVGLIRSRSGMAYKRNIYTEAGVIDSDYRGPIGVVMYTNTNGQAQHVKKGDRIAQLLIIPVCMDECVEVSSLDDTSRGDGGFGSTGN